MSSPNLNVLTLFGSVLAYSSGFLFAVDERAHSQGGASTAVLQVSPPASFNPPSCCWRNHFWIIKQRSLLQARMWTLCVGSTLVFGPILGKTWRLYRVFTQRVPDKRVVGILRPPGGRVCFQHRRPWIVFVIQSLQDALITVFRGYFYVNCLKLWVVFYTEMF